MAPSIDTALPTVVSKVTTVGASDQPVDRVKDNELKELRIAADLGAPDVYIDNENDTCWYHWTGTIWVKPLRFDNRSGTYVIALKTDPRAELGKHRHRGEVKAYTVSGSWGYYEYPWKAKAGDYITENPGTIHTLWMGEGAEVLFNVMGSIEFFHDDNSLREIMDGFSFWRMYVEHCEKSGIQPNEKLWY
ncbi:ChrR Cupin-like domain-containing protein [Cladophialophora immunda]|nr:ChrR Cupin-like domain-containing protein [Cladophialophora immunda]